MFEVGPPGPPRVTRVCPHCAKEYALSDSEHVRRCENKAIAREAMQDLMQSQEDQRFMRDGLGDPAAAKGPVRFMGAVFYPHPNDGCWRMYPAEGK